MACAALSVACTATRKGLVSTVNMFAHASFIPRNVWDLDILVIFPYHVTSQMFTVEMANCFDSAISYSLDKLGCSHLTLKDKQRCMYVEKHKLTMMYRRQGCFTCR